MQLFYPSFECLIQRLGQLGVQSCPHCRLRGTLVRHGFIRGYVTDKEKGIRAYRVYCSPRKCGCGRTVSLRVDTTLLRRCVTTSLIWAFLSALMAGRSVKAAWEATGSRLSLDCAYHLMRKLTGRLSVIREKLHAMGVPRAPPTAMKENGARGAIIETGQHLKKLCKTDPIRAFQQQFQTEFL